MGRGRALAAVAATGLAIAAVAFHGSSQRNGTRSTRPPRESQPPEASANGQPAVAQAPAEGSPEDATLAITGEVVDAGDGSPIARATVYAIEDGRAVAEADSGAGGRFRLDVPHKRRYPLAAAATGHVHSRIQACWTQDSTEATPGEHVRIAMERSLRIRGTVADQGGRGLGGATVRSASFHVESDLASTTYLVESTAAAATRTDALGRFEITEVPPRGSTTFLVSLDGYGDGRFTVDAAAIPSPPEYAVRLDALPTLAGRVVGEDGRPLAGVAVMPLGAVAGDVATAPPVLTSDAGAFRIAWRERASSLLVWGLGFLPAIAEVRPRDLLRGSLLEVRLERAGEVLGVVRDDRGLPVAGARVRVRYYEMEAGGLRGRLFAPHVGQYSPEEGVGWYLLPRDSSGCFCVAEALSDAEGSFRLQVAGRGRTGLCLDVGKEGCIDSAATWTDGSPPLLATLVRAARVVITASDARTGAALAEFRVTVLHPESPMVQRTNPATGEPVAAFVAPGIVRITVEAPGYERSDALAVALSPAQELVRRFDLTPK